MKGERQAADVHISAVGMRRQHTSHSPGLGFLQLKLVQLLRQTGNPCKKKKRNIQKG